jgi:hypothetical protein
MAQHLKREAQQKHPQQVTAWLGLLARKEAL